MNRWAAPIAVMAALLGAVGLVQHWQGQSRADFSAPDFALPDLNGTVYRLSDLRGKIVFLNLWATWCPPCREEMPAMEALYRRLKQRDFVMLAVSEDSGGAAVVGPFVKQNGLTFPVLLDPQAHASSRYGVTGYPETFVIDRAGNVIHHEIGPADWDSEQMIRYFEQLLAQPVHDRGVVGTSASG